MNCKNTEGKLCYVESTDIDQLTPPIYFADQEDLISGEDGLDTIIGFAGSDSIYKQPAPSSQPKPAPRAKTVPKVPNNEKVGSAKNLRWWVGQLPAAARAAAAAGYAAVAGALTATVGGVFMKRAENLNKRYNPVTREIQPGTPFFGTPLPKYELPPKPQPETKLELEKKWGEIPITGLTAYNTRVTARTKNKRCIAGPYNEIKRICSAAGLGQAHHIVPDYTLRYGSRVEGMAGIKRIPGLPSFGKGPAICLQGHAKTAGSEHSIAHQADNIIAGFGGQSGMAPISKITEVSRKAAINARKDCAKEITAALAAQPSLNKSILARTTTMPPNVWPPN